MGQGVGASLRPIFLKKVFSMICDSGRSQAGAVAAMLGPPGTFFSGRFAVLADDQHDDTSIDPIAPTDHASSTAVDSVHQESDTESVLSEQSGTVGLRQKLLRRLPFCHASPF